MKNKQYPFPDVEQSYQASLAATLAVQSVRAVVVPVPEPIPAAVRKELPPVREIPADEIWQCRIPSTPEM